ncbi:MAG: CapA family protein [bacterium]|nr:CapA family protein [bacterium]
MEEKFDSTGFKFVVKFIGQFVLLYFMTSFLSGFVFGKIYEEREYVFEVDQENLATVRSPEVFLDKKLPPIILGFVGDIMLDRGVEDVTLSNGGGDFKFVFKRVEKELNNIDLLFGNLEGPISDKGSDLGALYSFRMNPNAVEGLLYAGFDVLSMANNHVGDWGEEAIGDSVSRLKNSGIETVGAGFSQEEAYQPVIVGVGGLKVAFLSFTESAGIYRGSNIALTTEAKVRESVASLKEANLADFIVVSFHFGDEYEKESNERQKKLSYAAVDSGADLVVGSHPHVTQDMEKYKEGYIFYSLGNFVFDQYFSDETMRGWLLKVFVESDGEVSQLEVCDVFINSLFQPVILPCHPVFNF